MEAAVVLSRPSMFVPEDSVERFLNSLIDHSPGTVKVYRGYLNMLQSFLGVPLDLATFDELCAALNKFAERYSPSSRMTCKSALREFLCYLGKWEVAERIQNKGVEWIPRRGPTSEQIDLLLEVADFRERTLILMIYSTGIRIGELLGNHQANTPPARVEDIDWEQGLIRVRGKGGSCAGVPFFLRRQQAMRALRLWLKGRESGPIFKLSASHAWRLLNDLGRRAGIKLTPCRLRHSCARSMRRQGGDIFEVSAQLRHRNIRNTLAYERAEPQDLIRLAREREWR